MQSTSKLRSWDVDVDVRGPAPIRLNAQPTEKSTAFQTAIAFSGCSTFEIGFLCMKYSVAVAPSNKLSDTIILYERLVEPAVRE